VIEIRGVHKSLGQFSLRGVDLTVDNGEYMVVLGPTGAGKTVLLEAVAGLHPLDGGEIRLHGRSMDGVAPEHRNVAYVPQDYVLFSHMSLRANIEFPLVLRKRPRAQIDAIVAHLCGTLRITHLLDRRPRTLSGGEQQRGALARALSWDPELLLLDEPLSALDEGTRADLTRWLAETTAELGTTVIHVCHNFEEALDLGDRIAVMRDGQVLQVDTPTEVLRRPGSAFLARFMGCTNLLEVARYDAEQGEAVLASGGRLRCAPPSAPGPLLATVRPEEVWVATPGAGAALANGRSATRFRARLERVRDRGRQMVLRLEGPIGLDVTMTPQALRSSGVVEGAEVEVSVPVGAVHLLPRE
jgi:molybdate transport system ATP-binding protein